MHLQLFLDDKFIGEVPYDEGRYDQAYLIGKKLLLQDIFRKQIEESKKDPTFYIHAQSAMNTPKTTLLVRLVDWKKALP